MTKPIVATLCALWLAASIGLGGGTVAADTASYQYDQLGRLVRVTYDDGTLIVYSYDASGNRSSVDTTVPSPPPLLVGDQTVEPVVDSNAAGTAAAFQYTAVATGMARQLFVYLDTTSAATQVSVGLYDNSLSNHPGSLMASGVISTPVAGNWNVVAISPTSVNLGTPYWVAVLNPPGTGIIQFRDTLAPGGLAETSSETTLTALPAIWTTGAILASSPMSAYATP